MAPHLVHSHAHEEDIPGTVNLRAIEGDDTAYGQALFPAPANDPNDPLQWPNWKKNTILIICSLYSFLGNSALLGPSVYITIFAEEFAISPTTASGLISYPNIMYGCASGVCEALPVQLVNDIFFLHERGNKLGYYTVCLCWGSTGPLYAGYMLAGGYSWRLYFYVEAAFAGALLIAAFFFVEETTYKRVVPSNPTTSPSDSDTGERKVFGQSELEKDLAPVEHVEVETLVPPRKTFLQTLKPWSAINRDVSFFVTIARSFTYFLVPSVLWVVTSFGIYIGLGALAFNFTFPILITAPPYSWAEEHSGLIALANLVGYGLAVPLTWRSDRLAAHLTKKNNGIREAEMRLGVIIPAAIIGPCGLIVYGLTAQRQLH